MGNKWIKVLLQLVLGLYALCYGAGTLHEAFNWFGWACVVFGCGAAFFAGEQVICLLDKYERWKV